MHTSDRKTTFFYWSPRIIAIIYIGFLAIFALDVFIPEKTIDYYLIALFMHLIPNFILVGLLVLAWKYEKIGGLFYIFSYILFFLFFWDRGYLWSQLLLFSPLLIIGGLFLLDNFYLHSIQDVHQRSKDH